MSNETKNLEELSKPVAWSFEYAPRGVDYGFKDVLEKLKPMQTEIDEGVVRNVSPLYSQEYVNVLLAEMAALRAIAEEYRDLMHHMDAGGDFYQFQRDKAGEK